MRISNNGSSRKRFYVRIIIYLILLVVIVLQLKIITHTLATQASTPVSCIYQASPPTASTATPTPATPGIVLINEILPLPTQQWNCATQTTGPANSWLEIYNPHDQPFNLYAARASLDEGPGTPSYTLQPSAIIPAHGFFTCFPFMSGNLTTSLTPHPLSIRLLIFQTVIDQLTAPSLTPDTSYARIPDGSNNWQITTTPTINSNNSLPTPTTAPSGTSKHTRPTPTAHTTSPNAHPSNSTHATTTNIQPTWSTLWLPPTRTADTPLSTSNRPTTRTQDSTTSENLLTLPVKILLTAIIILLPIAIFWRWKLYKKQRK